MNRRSKKHSVAILAAAGLLAFGCSDSGGNASDAGADAGGRGGGSGGRGGNAGRDGGGDADAGASGGSFASGGAAGGVVPGTGGGSVATGGGGSGGGGGAPTAGATGSGGRVASGGAGASGGATGTGGRATGGNATGGGTGSGGAPASGGRIGSGGAGTGSGGSAAGSGGANTGGAATGGAATGGAATGGAATGGAATGGAGTGGAATGGAATGGAATGGAATGGAATGGANTGGAATGGAGTGGAGTGGAATGGAGGVTTASLYVVAHPDDELLFMNPDLHADITAGLTVRTVFLTSGDGMMSTDWMAREVAVRNAHAAMANLPSSWNCSATTYAGKSTQHCTLAGRPSLSMVYLRILDGGVAALRQSGSSGTIDNTGTYSVAQLLATLTAIKNETLPGKIGALDGTQAHGTDHGDHVAAGNFTFDVARADGVSRQLSMYRGYSMAEPSFVGPPRPSDEPPNVLDGAQTEKRRIVAVYQPTIDADFEAWIQRMYPIRALSGGSAPLRSGGLCLNATAAASGSPVNLAACTGSALQTWTVSASGRVTGQGGLCLGLDGTAAVLETCSGVADQFWSLLSDGQLHGQSNFCLTYSSTGSPPYATSSALCTVDMSQTKYFPPATQTWGF